VDDNVNGGSRLLRETQASRSDAEVDKDKRESESLDERRRLQALKHTSGSTGATKTVYADG
jgi:hypothetical protein